MRIADAVKEYLAGKEGEAAPGAAPAADEAVAGEVSADTGEEEGAPETDDEAPDPAAGEEEEGEAPAAAQGEGEGDADAAAEEEEPVPDAPAFWTAGAEDWAALSPAARALVLEREAQVDHRISSEAGRRAAEAKREAEAKAAKFQSDYGERIKSLDALIPELSARMKSKYEGVDWLKLSSEAPDEYIRLRAEYDLDADIARKALAEKQRAETEARQAAQEEAKSRADAESQALIARNPEYQGEAGQQRFREEATAVFGFAKSIGYTDDMLNMASATDFEVLRDAMKFRKVKKATASPAPRKPAPAQTTTKPAARKPAGDIVRKKRLTEAETAFSKSLAAGGRMAQIEAAARLMQAKKGA